METKHSGKQATSVTISPPRAEIVPRKLTQHGHTRTDNYYWLRDDKRENKKVLEYLEAENEYLESKLSHTMDLQDRLFNELKQRIDPNEESVPVKYGNYWYKTKYEPEKDYPIYVRQEKELSAEEVVILDVNKHAEGHEYYNIENWEVSPDGRYLAYVEDKVGREIYTLRIKDLQTGRILEDEIPGIAPSLAWANDNRTVFYVSLDEALIPHQVYRHQLGQQASKDVLVYQEDDNTFFMFLSKSRSKEHIVIGILHTLSTEMRLIDADNPETEAIVFLPREEKHEYWAEVKNGEAFILTNWQAKNFRLMRTQLSTSSNKSTWQDVIAHRDDVFIEEFSLFDNYLVVEELIAGITKLRVIPRDGGEEFYIASDEEAYTASINTNPDMSTSVLRYDYSSLATSESIYDYDMKTGNRELRKRRFAGEDYDRDALTIKRIEIQARDDTAVPVTLLFNKGLVPDGTHPLYVLGYGSYGSTYHPRFRRNVLSLVNRGFVFALAHIRGGQEMGRQWYENGKLLNKKNTFTDFIDVTRGLVELGWGAANKVVGTGRSAGGLLIGSVANMDPGAFTILVTEVPFVDVVTTMLDESIPLTTFEFDEWGNPKNKEYYDYMLSYSPYDQIDKRDYPHILVSAGLWDARVQYWEPAKWVAKLRTHKTDNNLLLFYTDMSAGHSGSAGRFKRLKDRAREYAFIFDILGIEY